MSLDLSEKAREMLTKWVESKAGAATYYVLSEALCHENVQRRDLMENVCWE